jgi:site-specific recombinase XerD
MEEFTEYKSYLIAKGYSITTTESMLDVAITFTAWIKVENLEAETLSYNDMTAFVKKLQARNLSQRTIQLNVIHIKHYLNYLVEASIMGHNPALALKIKNVKRKTVYNILSNEELEMIYKTYKAELPSKEKSPPQTLNKLARKRNKVLLGLLIYQGIATDDVKNIELKHLELREGKITIPGTRRSNERTLKLESHQVFDLYDYVNEVRKEILHLTKKQSNLLFISIGNGNRMQNMLQKLTKEITEQNSNVENLHQVRASIITNWLKQYNKRKVQYMAGHRYVSSTEAYEANNIDALQEDIQRFYPTLG